MTAEVPAKAVPGLRGPTAPTSEGERRRDGARSSLVWDVLQGVVAARTASLGRGAGAELDIVDVGGGTGGFAVPFAALGHRVTVVDPSPDALAAAQRRAAEMRVALTAVQGDAGELASLVGDAAADLVICHSVLEYVDSPAAAMAAIARVLRPGATVSVLAANSVAAVLQRALAGRYAEARRLLAAEGAGVPAEGSGARGTWGAGAPHAEARGTWGAGAPHAEVSAPRRFTLAGLTALIEDAGLRAGDAHGIRVFAGLLPGAGVGGGSAAAAADPAAAGELRALEEAAAAYPALRDIAARLHVLGHR
jgi:S-adenosylmethionine-dependent methyltransferase